MPKALPVTHSPGGETAVASTERSLPGGGILVTAIVKLPEKETQWSNESGNSAYDLLLFRNSQWARVCQRWG